MTLSLLHIAAELPMEELLPDVFRRALAGFGTLRIIEHGNRLEPAATLAAIQSCDVLLTGWGSAPVPVAVAAQPGRLRYICHLTGAMRGTIPLEIIESGLPVTNWGTAPAQGVAEGALTLLLATLKDLHAHIALIENDGWRPDMRYFGGSLQGLDVGLYGCGVIGSRFVGLLRPFGCTIHIHDPYAAELPAGCMRAGSLDALFATCPVISLHAALTDETRGSVDARLLAMLPRGGVIINTARGGLIDQPALFAELESGRLRAGLDVLEPDFLEPGHPARRWPNLILTPHVVECGWPTYGEPATRLATLHEVALDNLRRFTAGDPLRFVIDAHRYALST